jgi:peptidoglycan/xylan/chitin deacetylase (PgdA/CDA1 family)
LTRRGRLGRLRRLVSPTSSPQSPRLAALTLDLEPDCGGWVDSFDTLARIDRVVRLMRALDVPLTVFVVGRILEQRPDIVGHLATLPNVEFAVHGYAHDPARVDNSDEIRRGVAAFRNFFGSQPAGFRAPHGRIAPADFVTLQREGIAYDSSIFPSWRPGVFNNLGAPNVPYRHPSGLPELPVTVFRPVPVPVGLGYLRMFGLALGRPLLRLSRLPPVVVIGFHAYDLVENAHSDRIRPWLRWYFHRNVHQGPALLTALVAELRRRGYTFSTMQEALSRTMPEALSAERQLPPQERSYAVGDP